LQEQGGKTKSCEIEALRAGGGQAPGTLHHVIIRGIERKEIVKDDYDRQNFVYRKGTIALETRTLIYAWTLMTNHAHIFLRSYVGWVEERNPTIQN
jgi:hypothetical protein